MKKINIIFDNNDSNALSIINNIYKEFSYDYENLYSVNLGYCIKLIPTKEDLKYIDKEVDLIIWLISSSFFLDTEAYTLKFNELKKQGINQLPISICSTDAILFDEINTLIIKDNQSITELLCVIAQKLIGEKIDIFISYFRIEGSDICEKINNTMHKIPSYETFVDIHNIEYGAEIQKEIELKLQNSALLCISTDSYAQRFWCIKELIVAKQNQIPIIIADCLKDKELRRNPNSGNVPVVKIKKECFQENIYTAIFTLVKEVLRKKVFERTLSEKDSEKLNLWKTPELSDFAGKKIKKVCYPAPPICLCEREFYENIFTDITFYMHNQIDYLKTKQLKVCISLSDFQDNPHIASFYTDSLVNEIIRYLIYKGYSVNYGGDWRKSGYTEKFLDFVKSYRFYENSVSTIFYNYFANIDNNSIAEIKSKMYRFGEVIEINLQYTNGNLDKAKTLSGMRKQMIKESDAVIIIGGKLVAEKSYISGIAEEFTIAYSENKPIYLIGGQGGAAGKIACMLDEGKKYYFNTTLESAEAQVYCKRINEYLENVDLEIFSLNNKLGIEENKELFHSIDIERICNLIFKGLSEI